MSHIALLPLGSAGDVFPFIWLGKNLQRRGHRVTVITACLFEEVITRAGLDFRPVGKEGDFETLARDPRLWRLAAGTKLVFDYALSAATEYLDRLNQLRDEGRPADLIMAPLTAFGGRLAREKWGVPLVTVHLQPAALPSAWEMPLLTPGMQYFRKLPLWLRKGLFNAPNLVDLLVMPVIRRLCALHGIIAPPTLTKHWWNSPDGVLLLFPEWFARPQPDWPHPRLQLGFPLEDTRSTQPLGAELTRFLDGLGLDKPIVVTAGSANVQAREFFAAFASVIQRLERPAVFVTRDLSQLPTDLPERTMATEYAPFGPLLKHSALLVHHGGIGTMAQAIAEGVPQLIVPMAHDQFDNAERISRARLGASISKKHLTPDRIVQVLEPLLGESSYRHRCGEFAPLAAVSEGAVKELMDWIEGKVGGVANSAP